MSSDWLKIGLGKNGADTKYHAGLDPVGLGGGGYIYGKMAASMKQAEPPNPPPPAWWRRKRRELLELAANGHPLYVYDLATVQSRARQLQHELPAVDRFYYAMKANSRPEILRTVAERGFGIECVSAAEVLAARSAAGSEAPLLFTPNFCPMDEYRIGFESGAEVIIDGPHVLDAAPDLFRGATVALRVDPGQGTGHHEKVRTAGAQTKFGQPVDDLGPYIEVTLRLGVKTVGLHAHVGSGVLDPGSWAATGRVLIDQFSRFPGLSWVDLGGGLGVAERPGQQPLDLAALGIQLASLRPLLGTVKLRLEPGRFLVSDAGVLLAAVTQVRRKGALTYVGVTTGMNSLVRPALYDAWHGIQNLTRLDDQPGPVVQVVGPICESADVFGRDRSLPVTQPGDILLIENAGAYGAVMASRYNLREPAAEVVLTA